MSSVSIVAVPADVTEGEADVPCCICLGDVWTRANDIIKCAGGCGVVVHQGPVRSTLSFSLSPDVFSPHL
jgi:hypothetical protein